VLGVPHTIIVDDYLPLHKDNNKTLFANPGADKSLWIAFIEKAFAKFHGNYKHIIGGSPEVAIRTLIGGPTTHYKHKSLEAEILWEKLGDHD